MSSLGKRKGIKPPILESNKKQAGVEEEAGAEAEAVEGDDCAICFMPLNDGQNIISLEKKGQSCGHVFHENCINLWINSEANLLNFDKCPTCSVDMSETDIGKLSPDIQQLIIQKRQNRAAQGADAANIQEQLEGAQGQGQGEVVEEVVEEVPDLNAIVYDENCIDYETNGIIHIPDGPLYEFARTAQQLTCLMNRSLPNRDYMNVKVLFGDRNNYSNYIENFTLNKNGFSPENTLLELKQSIQAWIPGNIQGTTNSRYDFCEDPDLWEIKMNIYGGHHGNHPDIAIPGALQTLVLNDNNETMKSIYLRFNILTEMLRYNIKLNANLTAYEYYGLEFIRNHDIVRQDRFIDNFITIYNSGLLQLIIKIKCYKNPEPVPVEVPCENPGGCGISGGKNKGKTKKRKKFNKTTLKKRKTKIFKKGKRKTKKYKK
jgi:hypothetical protein